MTVDLTKRHPSVRDLMTFLIPNPNLPNNLKAVALEVEALATVMVEVIPDSAELAAGLRKLLEAKDCFVRASLGQG